MTTTLATVREVRGEGVYDGLSIEDIDAQIEPVVVSFTGTGPLGAPALDDQAARLRAILAEPKPKAVPVARATPPAPRPKPARPPLLVRNVPDGQQPKPKCAARPARVVTIASGKGGVGKTTLSVNLAIALAQRGLRTTLVDADLGTANADLLCGVSPKARLEHVFAPDRVSGGKWGDAAPRTLHQITIPAPGGFRLVPGTAGVARMADLSDVQRRALVAALAEVERDSDVVLIDAAAGVGRDVTAMMDAADLTLVVATPEPTSIADAYALIKCATASREDAAWADLTPGPSPEVALVMNQVSGESEARAVHGRIAVVAKRFLDVTCPMLGWVAHDLRVPEAVRARQPLVLRTPKTPSVHNISLLAAALVRQVGLEGRSAAPRTVDKGLRGLVRRLLGLSSVQAGHRRET